ncbi:diol dehydratase small subunit [Sinanaerobacter sp. ZZT-01]|uniref:diol dehydratase small subunit n=1 Tax=Sinanaerobacter sp. ZZT-01 TaxID=3111540 RepID=UPI002D785899|nr:diol dehydratase small subunit [Sinanaerobacter sp. ZZT-01]WRR92625.1 diol dehydratase small subunit [Sinanaerobacter sp. ZZT-01]
MNQELLMKQIVEEVMKAMSGNAAAVKGDDCVSEKITADHYPLGDKMSDKIFSPTGKKLSDMTIEQVLNGKLTSEDMRIAPETLELQAQVAESVGRDAFAANLRRASELITVPDDRLLEIYNALRPYRSTKEELYEIAEELEKTYGCFINATLVKEAAEVYSKRGRLRRD